MIHYDTLGARLKEAININKSLSTLSHIVSLLADAKSDEKRLHLPYRDSKLTQILQPALGGNNKTAFVCTVCLAWRFFEEVKRTLQFASTAKSVENKATVNIVVDDKTLLAEYKKEIERLKALLASGGGGGIRQEEFDAERNGRRKAEQARKQLQAQIDFMKSQVLPSGAGEESPSPRVRAFVSLKTPCHRDASV
eukprot:SAG31_NODE_34_length_31842_cov_31.677850_19_plen_195_part_00